MKKKIMFILCIITLISCKSPLQLINKTEISEIEIKDSYLLYAIDEYSRKQLDTKQVIIVMSKDINNFDKTVYINKIHSLSQVYNQPISSYFDYKGKKVLIYSKKDGYINPRYYTKRFIDEMKRLLDNDWNLLANEDGSLTLTGRGIISHSTPWMVFNKKIDSSRNNKFNKSRFLFNKEYFAYDEYDNLDNLRIVYPKKD